MDPLDQVFKVGSDPAELIQVYTGLCYLVFSVLMLASIGTRPDKTERQSMYCHSILSSGCNIRIKKDLGRLTLPFSVCEADIPKQTTIFVEKLTQRGERSSPPDPEHDMMEPQNLVSAAQCS